MERRSATEPVKAEARTSERPNADQEPEPAEAAPKTLDRVPGEPRDGALTF